MPGIGCSSRAKRCFQHGPEGVGETRFERTAERRPVLLLDDGKAPPEEPVEHALQVDGIAVLAQERR